MRQSHPKLAAPRQNRTISNFLASKQKLHNLCGFLCDKAIPNLPLCDKIGQSTIFGVKTKIILSLRFSLRQSHPKLAALRQNRTISNFRTNSNFWRQYPTINRSHRHIVAFMIAALLHKKKNNANTASMPKNKLKNFFATKPS